MNNFSIHHQLTLKEYRKIYYSLLYRKVFIIVISVFSILFIISTCILWINKNYDILNSDYYIYGIAIAALAIWIPLTTLYTLKRNYKSTYGLHEPVTYSFSDEGYSTIGESFSSKSDWTKIYKVKIIKGWLILYHSRMMANMIKIEPTDEENIEAFKKFLKEGNFKAKLRW